MARSSKTAKPGVKRVVRSSLPRHKRLMLHPVSLMTLLCAGILIVGWTFKAVADNVSVSAVVPATPLSTSAIITSPGDGASFTTSPITVSGTCPNGSYVNLINNNSFSGSAWCVNGNFSIKVSLFPGLNQLVAQDYNITNQPGPLNPAVNVQYQPAAAASASAGSSEDEKPLVIITSFLYKTFTLGSSFNWNLSVAGGVAPYTVNVSWGDGQNSNYQVGSSGSVLNITHLYHQTGYYAVLVKATDVEGSNYTIQLSALIKKAGTVGFAVTNPGATNSRGSSSSVSQSHWLLLAWPAYLVIALMVASFWLGEKEELRKLTSRQRHA